MSRLVVSSCLFSLARRGSTCPPSHILFSSSLSPLSPSVRHSHPRPPPLQYPATVLHKSNTTSLRRLFTPEEMANMSVANPLNRKNLKQEKKRKEREARRLMGGTGPSGSVGMEVEGAMEIEGGGDGRSAEDRFFDMMEE